MRQVKQNVLEVCKEDAEVIFCMDESWKDEIFEIKLRGSLTNEATYEFEDELLAALLACRKIEVDFSEVTYLASGAVQALLLAQQITEEQGNATLILKNVSGKACELLQEVGVLNLLTLKTS